MNTNAIHQTLSSPHIKVDATSFDGAGTYSLSGSQITPRGVCVFCNEMQINSLHGCNRLEAQPKFPILVVSLSLYFTSGEVVELETHVQIQSVRRISQEDFEVQMLFKNMVSEGYRHIARYMVESKTVTE